MRSSYRPVLFAAAICAAALVAVGCGSDSDNGGSASTAVEKTKVGWLIYGPKDDGGFAQIAYEAMLATKAEFGPKLDNLWADNVPFGKQTTTITERFAADGAKLLIDTGAVGDLFLDVCKAQPDKHCIEATYIGKPPANVSSYWSEWWKQEYLLGMAAGKLTTSNVIGYVQPYDIPIVYTEQNAWLLGCQSVNPQCKMRVVNINTWYDPPKTTQATNTLVDAGADVINSFVSDPSYCSTADKRKVWAVGLYKDWSKYCPNGYINGALWDLGPYFTTEVGLELAGKWTGGRMTYTALGDGATLGKWGKNVPTEVSDLVDAEYERLVASKEEPIKGPIYDTKGKLRVKAGETVTQDFLYDKWDWLVKGTIG